MKRTPLYQEHVTLGGDMVEYAGWDLPLHFKLGIVEEHNAVRNAAGAFDVSHMGDLIIRGEGAVKTAAKLFTNDLTGCKVGRAKYTHILNENGKIIDDAMVIKVAEHEYLCVPNAATTQKVKDWIAQHGEGIIVEDYTGEVSCVSVQGPKASDIVAKIFGENVKALKKDRADFFPIPAAWHVQKDERHMRDSVFHKKLQEDVMALISRTGYTGEDGFEIVLPIRAGIHLWRAVLAPENNCVPIGLGARDTLRMEMGYLLSGQDFREDRTSLEAASESAVDWTHDFIGRAVLEEQKRTGGFSEFTGLVMEESGVPKAGYKVYLESGEELGKLTSGGLSPTMNKGMGLGYFDPKKALSGVSVLVEIKDKKVKARIAKPPLIARPPFPL